MRVSEHSSAGTRTSAVAWEGCCRPIWGPDQLVTQPRQVNLTVVYDTLEDTVDSCCAPSSRILAIDTVGDSLQESRMRDENKWALVAVDGEDAETLVYSTPARKGSGAAGVDVVMGKRRAAAGSDEYPVLNVEGVVDGERKDVVGDGLDGEDDVPGAADDPPLRTVRPYTLLPLATLRQLQGSWSRVSRLGWVLYLEYSGVAVLSERRTICIGKVRIACLIRCFSTVASTK